MAIYQETTLPGRESSSYLPLDVSNSRRERIKKSIKYSLERLHNAINRTESLIQEWTPLVLVSLYFVCSICLYIICTPGIIAIFWFVYLTTNFYIAAATVIEAIMSMTPCREARKALTKLQELNWLFPTPDDKLLAFDLVIVAYLPNEKDIILDRIHYALEKIVYPKDKMRINVVYNTPIAIEPLETEMQSLTEIHQHLRVIKVNGSTSKADNLNYFFTLNTGADIIAIFDCDHYTHPYGPRWAIERFLSDYKIDIVQGRCVIFNSNASFLAAMIAVEFDKNMPYRIPEEPLRGILVSSLGESFHVNNIPEKQNLIIGRSNGYWRASLLRDLKMNGDMLTEDIDSSLRAVSRGANTVHDMNVISYELAPTTIPAFWKQRLRWAQGWAQASLKHFILTFNKPINGRRNLSQRFGLLSLLLIREMSYYLVTQYCCLVASIVFLDFPTSGSKLVRILFFQYPVAYWLFVISVICLVCTLVITNQARSEFIAPWMIIAFSLIFPFYLILAAIIGLYGHARAVSKYTAWNPTPRS